MSISIGSPMAMHNTPPDFSLRGMAYTVGDLPPGEQPAAWFMSQHPDVLAGYRDYATAAAVWRDRFAQLMGLGELPHKLRFATNVGAELVGLIPPDDMEEPPRWWRRDGDLLVPRKRTTAERDSEVNRLWDQLHNIPRAIDYMPGMPTMIWVASRWMGDEGHPVYARRCTRPNGELADAVCAFMAHDPEKASQPFIVGPQWSKMKLSTFHLLRERQRPSSGPEWYRPDV